jgi:aryl-alcohol dehydrogenase-like predicted oxidoreductase
MKIRLLGKSGLKVSEVVLGTMTFGETWGFGANEEVCRQILNVYQEAGGNFIDTANKYTEGHSEEIIGRQIAENRDYWVVATKYTLSTRSGDPNSSGNSRKNMMRSVEASLKRLQSDYIDLLWVHAWDNTTPIDELMRGLDDLVRQGKVLYIGISDAPAWIVSAANTMAELQGWSRFVGLQIEYSLLERTVERELVPMAERFGLGVAAWGPMAGGVLTGKYTRGETSDTLRADMNRGRLTERGLTIAREVDAVADELGAKSAHVALRWLYEQGKNVFPIVGARKVEQLQDALQFLELNLSPEHKQRLDQVSKIEKGFPYDFIGNDYIKDIVFGDSRKRYDF